MFEKFRKLFAAWRLQQNYKAAVRKANYLQAKTFKIQLVFKQGESFIVVDRNQVKLHYRQGRFKKGLTLKEVYGHALYTTTL
jgi:hypothetical protein